MAPKERSHFLVTSKLAMAGLVLPFYDSCPSFFVKINRLCAAGRDGK